MALNIPKRAFPEFPYARFKKDNLGLERGSTLEWILANGLGGYASSTVVGLNTRKYHGLLVSATEDVSRLVCLQKLDDEIRAGGGVERLGVDEFKGGVVTGGWKYLSGFDLNHGSASFRYSTPSADLVKSVSVLEDRNAVRVSYEVGNRLAGDIEVRVNVLANSRSIYDLSKAGERDYRTRIYGASVLGVGSDGCFLTAYSDKAECRENPLSDRWIRDVCYSSDRGRGDTCMEDIYFPAFFSLKVAPGVREEFNVMALGYGSEDETAAAFKELQDGFSEKGRVLSSGAASSIIRLLSNAESFVVKKGAKKTIIAGYHWFGEWGRDAMISLPGTTLVAGRFDDAERIFENFLNHAGPKGIPNRFVSGKPEYSDVDSFLWLVDRLYQYAGYAGPEKAKAFLKAYWWTLKDVVKSYSAIQQGGILAHKAGTWMDTLRRDNAVEVQALWYNALKVMERFAVLMEDDEFDVSELCGSIEGCFFERYWNGRYLSDCLGDDSLRPNQVIAASLDFRLLDEHSCKKVIDVIEKELLTPYGLRTLSPGDSRYRGAYAGDFSEREKAYHNGTVWPWLLGPYVRAYMRLYNNPAHAQGLLEPLFGPHLKEAGIGTISEIFDGNSPHRPGGCISQAWSVAEPLRAYFEDVIGRKPPHII
ncbi:MAG: glycogen debranching enzyme family protein [Candidatus Altiarchaeota archaeon]|nr:glycogen debranching enzyme family protein [Candidatus Altiarchaeota archaeon]